MIFRLELTPLRLFCVVKVNFKLLMKLILSKALGLQHIITQISHSIFLPPLLFTSSHLLSCLSFLSCFTFTLLYFTSPHPPEASMTPGIWMAPFACDRHSELAKNHPDWILTRKSGILVRNQGDLLSFIQLIVKSVIHAHYHFFCFR